MAQGSRDGGQARRSAASRAAILAAARHQFTTAGYTAATIRAIAAEARLDPALVIRYFGSKAGLFAAAIDVDLSLPQLDGYSPDTMAEPLARHFIELWESPLADDVLILLLRSAVTDAGAAQRVRELFAVQVAAPIARALQDPDAERRAALIGTQLLGMALCRYILQLPPLVTLDRETVIAELVPAIRRYLIEPLPTS